MMRRMQQAAAHMAAARTTRTPATHAAVHTLALAGRPIASAGASSFTAFLRPFLPAARLALAHPRAFSSFAAQQRLSLLRVSADGAPSDVHRQYQYLKEANRLGQHEVVVARVDSGRFATNPSIQFEYHKAINAIRQRDQQAQATEAANQQQQIQAQQYAQQASPASQYAGGASSSSASGAPGSAPTNPVVLHEVLPRVDWSDSFFSAIPIIAIWLGLIAAYHYYTESQKGKGGDGAGSDMPSIFNPFGQTKDFLNREMSTVRFKDVKGCDEAKAELQEIVEFLRNPAKFERLGGKMTKGVLLTGDPGTGKTLLAKAVAGEAGVPFFSASGAEFDEAFVGVGAKRVRELFAAARKQKRAIIFIDEIDAVGGNRDRVGSSHGRATINALLTEMDGFVENTGIVVIGATNLDRVLDPALVRPGRFDRRVAVSLPDAQGRLEILQLYASKMKLHPGVDLKLLSQSTSGMSGADLNNLLNTAAIRASAQGKSSIDHDEIEYAYDKILMGAERSFTQSPEVKANTAYHEAGHTILLLNTPGAPDLHKVTILPRGRALGAMFFLPLNEHRILTRRQLLANIDISMGGRAAEEFLHGKDQITSGASNDLEKASSIARAMVTQYGMGASTGIFTLPAGGGGGGPSPSQIVSPETLKKIDEEVSQILSASYERTKRVIEDHRAEWVRLAQALIEHEALDRRQVMQAIRGEKVDRKLVNKFRPISAGPADPPSPESPGVGGLPLPEPVTAPVQKV